MFGKDTWTVCRIFPSVSPIASGLKRDQQRQVIDMRLVTGENHVSEFKTPRDAIRPSTTGDYDESQVAASYIFTATLCLFI
jgi:hypothetical protein